mmetsp:Transcript_92778/g.276775  ORF Transcript_92778/g.276775 Transcript_92778/m.276775 type:complete len:211 (-) Transcript_92778:23-655(-)
MNRPMRGSTWLFSGHLSAYGISRESTSNIRMPNEKTSIRSSYSWLLKTSGAIHRQVPTQRVMKACVFFSSFERPKSATLAVGVMSEEVTRFASRTLQLFRSRWRMIGFLVCRYSMPLATSSRIFMRCRHVSSLLVSWMRSYKLPPAQYSETMTYGALVVASKHFTRFGCPMLRVSDSHLCARSPAGPCRRFTATVMALVVWEKHLHHTAR